MGYYRKGTAERRGGIDRGKKEKDGGEIPRKKIERETEERRKRGLRKKAGSAGI